MTTRATLKTLIWGLLGTTSDDPAYSDTILDPLVQQAVDSLLHDIQEANPDYLSTSVTLAADSTSSHLYTFSTQASPVTDFARVIEVRYTDSAGTELAPCRREELRDAGTGFYALIGPDEAPVLHTSPDSTAGAALYFLYGYWPAVLASDSSEPTGIPSRFQDVVAYETAAIAFGLGGEQRMPDEIARRWRDRRGQLLKRVGQRSVWPSRSRLVNVGLD